ncbi:MAG: lamin tail domain-containing protein, partial [Verrucomicrobiales bacterium]
MQLNKRLIFKLTLIASALLRWTAQADQVVISEIMYHPRGEQPEFVELTNITATPLDIIRWRFTNGA